MKKSPRTITMSEICGIGTDILEIERFKEALQKHGQAFLDKLFTKQEQEYCKRFSDPIGRYTARFSAKEAVAKALGTGFGKELAFHDIEILNESSGKPTVKLSSNALTRFGHPTIHLSISHSTHYATATAIATK